LAKVGIEQAMNNCLLPADLARNIEHLTSTLSPEAKDDTTLDSLLRKLRGRDRIIHQAISHYISTLIQFSNITRTNAWRDSEEIRDQLIAVDQRRRRNHNSMTIQLLPGIPTNRLPTKRKKPSLFFPTAFYKTATA
jgi:hypothetical protein